MWSIRSVPRFAPNRTARALRTIELLGHHRAAMDQANGEISDVLGDA